MTKLDTEDYETFFGCQVLGLDLQDPCGESVKISEITRRDIVNAICEEGINWAGQLDERKFLSRLFDLGSLPSTDTRFSNAAGDIWQHRINNPTDWDDDWVFFDSRFNLLSCDDEVWLRFLCETIHPIPRPVVSEAERLCQLYNAFLKNDGFQLVERTRLSGKPVFVGHNTGIIGTPGLLAAKKTLSGSDPTYVAQQITRMEAAVDSDPELAIGTAKELIETCCKTILKERGVEFVENSDMLKLVKNTAKELSLTRDDIEDNAKLASTVKNLLSNLTTIAQGIAELRNTYGTGHGKEATTQCLGPRHAKLAVGAASTLAVFLVETHRERPS